MKKNIALILAILLVGCANQNVGTDLTKCNPEIIYEYEKYMGLLIGGEDRTYFPNGGYLEEGADLNVVGVWESTEEDGGMLEILVIFEDGYAVVTVVDYTGLIQVYEDNFLDEVIVTIVEGKEILTIRGVNYKRKN